jgi:branched-chain amino acid transport system substrate-binding protein
MHKTLSKALSSAAFLAIAASALAGLPAHAADTIVIGRSLTLSGPLKAYGEAKRDGGDAYIAKVNAAGGINGKKIELITLDDAYLPANIVANLKKLAAENQPVAFLGIFGVPTSAAALPVLAELQIPAVGLTSGTEAMRKPFNRYAFPVRASYADEARKLVSHANTIGISRVEVIYLDNPFGAGLNAALADAAKTGGLTAKALKMDVTGANAVALAAEVAKDQPQAVFLATLSGQGAQMYAELKKAGYRGSIYGFSPLDTTVFTKLVGAEAKGLGISQVFPIPNGVRLKVVAEYVKDVKDLKRGVPSFYGIEAYVEAKVLVEGLRRAGAKPTPASLVKSLETMKEYDAGGFYVSYTPEAHTGSTFVEITVVNSNGEVTR